MSGGQLETEREREKVHENIAAAEFFVASSPNRCLRVASTRVVESTLGEALQSSVLLLSSSRLTTPLLICGLVRSRQCHDYFPLPPLCK